MSIDQWLADNSLPTQGNHWLYKGAHDERGRPVHSKLPRLFPGAPSTLIKRAVYPIPDTQRSYAVVNDPAYDCPVWCCNPGHLMHWFSDR